MSLTLRHNLLWKPGSYPQPLRSPTLLGRRAGAMDNSLPSQGGEPDPQSAGSMQVRTFRRRYSSSRSPYARRWMTRILLFRPSTKPRETLSSNWINATMPPQWLSIILANSSYGLSRCHFKEAHQFSKNFLAQPSCRYSQSWLKDSFRR